MKTGSHSNLRRIDLDDSVSIVTYKCTVRVVLNISKKVLVLGLFAIALSGCTSIDELKSTKAYTPKIQRDGAVNVASRATGLTSNKVGKTTLLTIPLGSIKAHGDTSANIMKSVGQALTAAGYNSDANTSYRSANAGYLRAHVEEIKFGNFFFSSWGTIILHLRLETRDGALLWKKRIRTSINAINNYDRTAIVAMNSLVKDMVKTFLEVDFYAATQRVKRHNDFLQEETAETQQTSSR